MAKQPKKAQTTPTRAYSRPALSKMIMVNSEYAIRATESYVNTAMRSLYGLDVILYYIGTDDFADMANQEVQDLLEKENDLYKKEIDGLQYRLKDDHDEISYSLPMTVEYKVYSPLCGRYLELIKKMDMAIHYIDMLWLNEQISSKKRSALNWKKSAQMLNFSRRISNASRRAMAIAKDKGKAEDVLKAMESFGIDAKAATELLDSNKDLFANEEKEQLEEKNKLEGTGSLEKELSDESEKDVA